CKASMRRGAFVMHVPVIGEAMSDPVADFLAREQDVLAGIDGAPLPAPAADSLPPTDNGHSELNGFEELNTGGDSGVDLTILDSTHIPMARHSANTTPSPLTITSTPKVEPEKIRKWREEQKIILQKKDEAEERKKEEMRAAAKKELDEWYAQRAEQLRKTKAANRKLEQELLAERDSTEGGAEWDRIAKLCEFNTKNSKNTADVSRLRSLLLQLKSRKE
uniref:Clathrin light chain n=1 Tax=Parascaris univalens TaxID=6257 RepID=A0A915ANT3_PARUN